MLRAALDHWGLRPGTDVKITPLNSIQGQIAAFQQHLVQGLVVDPPNNVLAQKVGAQLMTRIADLGIPYQAAGLVTTRDFLQSHHGVVVKVVQAMIEAVHRFKTDRAFAEKVMRRARPFNGARLGRTDFELAVHRDRIAIDDFAEETSRERQRQGRFAASRGTENHHH